MEENKKICTNCGQEVNVDAIFCVHCGQSLEENPSVNFTKKKFCTSCGEELPENSTFCVKCGQQIGVAAHSQAVINGSISQSAKGQGLTGIFKKAIMGIAALLLALLAYSFIVGDQPKHTLSANQLAQEYKDNANNANSKYKDKVIEVSGKVYNKGQFSNSTSLFIELGHTSKKDDVEILLAVPLSEKDKVNNLKVGDIVTATGMCVGLVPQDNRKILSVQINDSKIK